MVAFSPAVMTSMRRVRFGTDNAALVDNNNHARLSKMKWYLRQGTAHRSLVIDGKQKHIPMAAYIIDIPAGMLVVYKDGNKLNLQRDNLAAIPADIHRRTSRPAQSKKQSKYGHVSSVYKGVTHYDRQWWVARIWIDGKNKSLGYFSDEVTAARAYDRAVLEHFGEHAYRNFPELPSLTGFIGRKRPYVVGSESSKRVKGKGKSIPGATRRPPSDEESDFDDDGSFF